MAYMNIQTVVKVQNLFNKGYEIKNENFSILDVGRICFIQK